MIIDLEYAAIGSDGTLAGKVELPTSPIVEHELLRAMRTGADVKVAHGDHLGRAHVVAIYSGYVALRGRVREAGRVERWWLSAVRWARERIGGDRNGSD